MSNINKKAIQEEVEAIVSQAIDYKEEKKKERQDTRKQYDNLKTKYETLVNTYNVEQLKAGIAVYEESGFKVPVEGSIGLLTLGFRGVKAWRERKILHNIEVFGHRLEKMKQKHGFD